MKVLRARLYDLLMEKRAEEQAARQGTRKQIAFGSQIRSYFLHPHKLVKDPRSSGSRRRSRHAPQKSRS